MASGRESPSLKGASPATPFVVGGALAIALFAFFGLDLAHHWVPYSPNKPRLSAEKLFPLVVWLALLVPVGARWLRQRQSRSWPWVESTIEGGSIRDVPRRHGRSCLLTVTYSYSVRGEKYGGVYVESCSSEPEAEAVLQSLRSLPPPARYKPDDPFVSLIDPYRDAVLATASQDSEKA